MLGKLIRYDFKAVQRLLFPVYGAKIVLSVVIGLTSHTDGGSGYTVFQISMTLFMMILFAAVLLCGYRSEVADDADALGARLQGGAP